VCGEARGPWSFVKSQPDAMSESAPAPIDYKSAGVDLETYEETMAQLPPLLRRTYTPRVLDWPGGFAGLFRLDDQIGLLSRRYRDPVLVASTDGVGTKLKLAFATGRHATVGIDLVAMSVNDCLCAGAEPLLFLDYVAMSRDDPALTRDVVKGVSDGCVEAECALLGGETAILPDFYKGGEYDLAGFCVGVVERKHILDGSEIRAGDKVIGLASSGLHSNGYSLARKIAFDHLSLQPDSFVEELGKTVAEEFLEPTRIYVRAVKTVYRHYRVKRIVHGIAHITGGGLIDNPPRVLPEGLAIRLTRDSWEVPRVFPWLQKHGSVPDEEMFRVFNMGIGLVLIVADYHAEAITRYLRKEIKIPSWVIGEVIEGDRNVVWG
jgi:phosphoribosylformylglycinamidine cyclo-ligase